MTLIEGKVMFDIEFWRETGNGSWFHVNYFLVLVFGRYLYVQWCEYVNAQSTLGPSSVQPTIWKRARYAFSRGWLSDPLTQATAGLFVYMSGSMVIRFATWLVLLYGGWKIDASFANHYLAWLSLESQLAAVLGGMCCLRVFLPRYWSKGWWIIGGALCLLTPVIVHIVDRTYDGETGYFVISVMLFTSALICYGLTWECYRKDGAINCPPLPIGTSLVILAIGFFIKYTQT